MSKDTMNLCRSMSVPMLAALALATPLSANAEDAGDNWRFSTTIYAWLPTLSGDASIQLRENRDVSVEMDPGDVLDALDFAAMAAFEAEKGRWGLVTDLIYLDLSNTEAGVKDFTIGNVEIPASASAEVEWDLSGWIWTTGVTWLAVEDPRHPVKLIGGARMLDLTAEVKIDIQGNIGSIPLPGRMAQGKDSGTVWDAFVGVKGRFDPGEADKWFVPYYLDIGTGESDLTWQGVLGVGYTFGWGDLLAAWRYLDYDFSNDNGLRELTNSGVAIGATFRF
jgi:hypothetical protein